jgi:tRNA-(ms[2]io[6]A)-hydroxylase
MLHLATVTDPDWARRAIEHLDRILLDHAHLEKKAAGNAVALLFQYPEHAALMQPLSALAREELEHFELVLTHLTERGIALSRLPAAPYAGRLRAEVQGKEPHRLLDLLLVSALIEARSCERMKVLAEALETDPAHARLARLYRGLLAAEARHHRIYVELAGAVFSASEVAARLAELTLKEASILATAPKEPRLHNG